MRRHSDGGPGIFTDSQFFTDPVRARPPFRRGSGATYQRHSPARHRQRRASAMARVGDTDAGNGLETVSAGHSYPESVGSGSAVSDAAGAKPAAAEPAAVAWSFLASGAQYGHQFCHQYQLAVLRRGNHLKLLQPDGGTDRTELPVGGYRYRSDLRPDPRLYAPEHGYAGQRLDGFGAHYAVDLIAARPVNRPAFHPAGRTAKPAALSTVHQR